MLSFFWFFVTYLVRIYVNLFLEPTVNPIKHFPVVTVAAKLIVPFFGILFPLFETPFLPLGTAVAKSMATLNIILLPGIFGFLVWELRENWRLYRANRSLVLRPAVIGHHGETMSRLLRPGFHSGTVPNLYAKLRRAERQSYRSGEQAVSRKYREPGYGEADPDVGRPTTPRGLPKSETLGADSAGLAERETSLP